MTAPNKQALRRLAEKASPGPWEMEQENIWYTDADGYTKHLMYAYQGDDVDDQQDHDNTAYIAAFNPTTTLALLDELEESRAREANESDCADSTINLAINWQMRCKDAEAKLEAAERRIAELEAREVKLPPTFWYEHDDLPREIPVLSRRLVINALREAGVKIAAGIGVKQLS